METNPCFCVSLKRGVLLIAVFDILIGTLGAGLGVFAIFTTVLGSGSSHHDDSFGSTTTTSTTISSAKIDVDNNDPEKSSSSNKGFIAVLLGLFVIYCLLQVGFGGVLIYGLLKEKLLLLKAWLGFRASGALFTLGTLVAFLFLGEDATIQPGIVDGFSLLFSIYCLWVVYIMTSQIKAGSIKNLKPFHTDQHQPQPTGLGLVL